MPTATTQLVEATPSKFEEGRIPEAGASGNYLLFNRQVIAAEANRCDHQVA
jgi:hypothetical protein